MKYTNLIILLFISSGSFAQVTILDSNVSYDSLSSSNLLTVFLSPPVSNTDLNAFNVKIGSTYGASDVFNTNYTVGSNVNVENNKIQVPLTGVSSGDYFVAVTITRASDSSTQVMEYKMQ